ncbi:hypothetical protein [Alkalihalobacillus sp. AL-G]|uniref:hypothetical protein n=1 Tax=Alkalihalobacillus sp. AL-G TaxID=2926399 RepID=UPI00272AA289|nr:hypothetical protein [Alkalihalobacillus sp. AL-G]WLD91878.1 hypothetical protein MOJ78_12605 [Alkalihalobacillus sp. AL-G]
MIITSCKGQELEKSQSNSPEDFFNRSVVTYKVKAGKERSFSLLYLRYFEEKIAELTPFNEDPIFEINNQPVHLRDVIGLIALNKHPEYEERHRVYINEENQFADLFKGIEADEIQQMITHLYEKGQLNLHAKES